MSNATRIDRWPVVVHVLETTEQLFLATISQNRDYTFVHTHTIAKRPLKKRELILNLPLLFLNFVRFHRAFFTVLSKTNPVI